MLFVMSLESDLLSHSSEVSTPSEEPIAPVSKITRIWMVFTRNPFIVCCLRLLDEYYYERWFVNCVLSALTASYSVVSLGTQNANIGNCYPSFIAFLGAVLTMWTVIILFRWLYKFWYNRMVCRNKLIYLVYF